MEVAGFKLNVVLDSLSTGKVIEWTSSGVIGLRDREYFFSVKFLYSGSLPSRLESAGSCVAPWDRHRWRKLDAWPPQLDGLSALGKPDKYTITSSARCRIQCQ